MSDLADKIAKANAGGHTISHHLADILEGFDKRISALEPKKAETDTTTRLGPSPSGQDAYKLAGDDPRLQKPMVDPDLHR